MNIYTSTSFDKSYKKIIGNNHKLHIRVKRILKLFIDNQNHTSLRLHKLSGANMDTWSISVNRSIRITFQYEADGIVLTNIGTHDEVY